jgi:hypothetical protein
MYTGQYVFTQLTDHLPWHALRRCVARYNGEHQVNVVAVLAMRYTMRAMAPVVVTVSRNGIGATSCSPCRPGDADRSTGTTINGIGTRHGENIHVEQSNDDKRRRNQSLFHLPLHHQG